jgi:hypothetical protein
VLQFFCSFEFSVSNSGFGENLPPCDYFDSKDSAFLSILILRQHFEHGQSRQLKIAAEKIFFS